MLEHDQNSATQDEQLEIRTVLLDTKVVSGWRTIRTSEAE
jgi:hypothetical protein